MRLDYPNVLVLSEKNLKTLLVRVQGKIPGRKAMIHNYIPNLFIVRAETDEEHYANRPFGAGQFDEATEEAVRNFTPE